LECGDRLGYVHIGESHRGYLGSGTVDFPRLFRALARADYEGPIAFESFSSVVVSHEFCSALAVWRNLWEDGSDLAQHARQFMQEQLEAARRAVE
jgi:D-psicose/D-tagatose/L-ribulose 3-epimerase